MIVAMLFGVFFSADIKVNAVEDEDVLLESSDDIVIVDDIDEYIEKLNAGIIAPVNSKIETYEPKKIDSIPIVFPSQIASVLCAISPPCKFSIIPVFLFAIIILVA